jgi:hypothetical protein
MADTNASGACDISANIVIDLLKKEVPVGGDFATLFGLQIVKPVPEPVPGPGSAENEFSKLLLGSQTIKETPLEERTSLKAELDVSMPELSNDTEELYLKIAINKIKLRFLAAQNKLLDRYYSAGLDKLGDKKNDFLVKIDNISYLSSDADEDHVKDFILNQDEPIHEIVGTAKFYLDILEKHGRSGL